MSVEDFDAERAFIRKQRAGTLPVKLDYTQLDNVPAKLPPDDASVTLVALDPEVVEFIERSGQIYETDPGRNKLTSDQRDPGRNIIEQ